MIWRMLAMGALAASTAQAGEIGEAPKPWFKNGAPPAAAECDGGVDTALEASGTPNLTLKCDATVAGFVGVMQRLDPDPYRNRRVRFSALVKTEGVEGWGGLWMRVDDVDMPGAAFDNMQNRPLKGTSDWTSYSVVLDASSNAQGVFFGTLMSGKGQLWISDWRLEIVGTDVPTTALVQRTAGPAPAVPSGPSNLELAR
jgi:hypothetical protein